MPGKEFTLKTVQFLQMAAGFLWHGQKYLLYPLGFPPYSRQEMETPQDRGVEYEDVTLDTLDGIKIRCYLVGMKSRLDGTAELSANCPTIIMFHGNGENLGDLIDLGITFHLGMPCNVLMASYRGYGYSKGIRKDAQVCLNALLCALIRLNILHQAALDYVMSHPILGPSDRNPSGSKVILFGHSLGGAVALDLAMRNPSCISGLILDNTFLSIPRLIPTVAPILSPFAFLCHQTWDNAAAIATLPADMALLMLSGTRDQLVPAEHMAELWRLAQNSERKNATWRDFPWGTHTCAKDSNCLQPGYWDAIIEFMRREHSLDMSGHILPILCDDCAACKGKTEQTVECAIQREDDSPGASTPTLKEQTGHMISYFDATSSAQTGTEPIVMSPSFRPWWPVRSRHPLSPGPGKSGPTEGKHCRPFNIHCLGPYTAVHVHLLDDISQPLPSATPMAASTERARLKPRWYAQKGIRNENEKAQPVREGTPW
ncbi:Alpha/Beta hydrolase protein [Gautieria morchelliformis]|nr:Alpha/Beta hydrolase protein [Gautieria morchelliformis]